MLVLLLKALSINYLSVISYQLPVISYQLSIINYQLSVISYQLNYGRCNIGPAVGR